MTVDRTPIEPGDVVVRPVRFAHVDRRTGVTLAEFGSAEEAQDALSLVGPLADVEVDAIFAPEIPEGGASGYGGLRVSLRSSTDERFWARVDGSGSGGCWLWTGAQVGDGYAQFKYDGRRVYVHRYAYEALVGPIPDGLVLDHVCRVRHCVNPAHLEPVTPAENQRRGLRGALTTHCPAGHPYDEENTYVSPNGWRNCRACRRVSAPLSGVRSPEDVEVDRLLDERPGSTSASDW